MPEGGFFAIIFRTGRRLINSEKSELKKKQPVTWHTAFYDAIRLELYQYRDVLSFEFEHPLNTEPLRIDVVIIKKESGVVIEKPIGAFFRGVNLVEYKSPRDYLAKDDFHKVGAYARLYSVLNQADITDITVSFVEEAHPRKLLDYLRDVYRYKVTERWPGIYHVSGDIMPVQIIESKRLREDDNIWLRDLRGGLDAGRLRKVLELSKGMPKGSPLSAYINMVLRANPQGLQEVLKMSDAALEAVFEEFGLTEKWIEQGIEQGREQGEEQAKLLIAKNLVNMGWGIESVAKATELDASKLQALYRRR
ncbi:MAG: hypothetical protein LBC31_11920 [Treponema sp.]|nr:hypothetical protein [Treponema sp.]